jgi:hypothetical protein
MADELKKMIETSDHIVFFGRGRADPPKADGSRFSQRQRPL